MYTYRVSGREDYRGVPGAGAGGVQVFQDEDHRPLCERLKACPKTGATFGTWARHKTSLWADDEL